MSEATETRHRSYTPYACQRLYRTLVDLKTERRNMTFSAMAEDIYLWRGIKFQRMNFYRLRDGTLKDDNIEIIVSWLENKYDPQIRTRLVPQAIFDDVGKSVRDYYFHMPTENNVDEWNTQILNEFSGVYLCAKAEDRNSYLPLPALRRWFADPKAMPEFENKSRSVEISQYIRERSILILQAVQSGYFYAAEFPLALLFPPSVETSDVLMVYEGVGIISSNSIHVNLRECLSRVPKTHSILIGKKSAFHSDNPYGFSMFLYTGTHYVKDEWHHLTEAERAAMMAEYAATMEAEYYLAGPAQICVSPIPYMNNNVGMTFAQEMVYHRKPRDFLRDRDTHFLLPTIDNTEQIEKILANPLTIGELL